MCTTLCINPVVRHKCMHVAFVAIITGICCTISDRHGCHGCHGDCQGRDTPRVVGMGWRQCTRTHSNPPSAPWFGRVRECFGMRLCQLLFPLAFPSRSSSSACSQPKQSCATHAGGCLCLTCSTTLVSCTKIYSSLSPPPPSPLTHPNAQHAVSKPLPVRLSSDSPVPPLSAHSVTHSAHVFPVVLHSRSVLRLAPCTLHGL